MVRSKFNIPQRHPNVFVVVSELLPELFFRISDCLIVLFHGGDKILLGKDVDVETLQ